MKTKTPAQQSAPIRRFLVIRTDRIGDVVLSTPVMTALKRSFPGCFTAMLLQPYTAELVEGHPDVDLILLDPKPLQSAWSLAKFLRRHHFDTVLLLHPSLRLALACRYARIPLRVGSGYRAYSFLYSRRVWQHRKNSEQHELDLNLQMAHTIGAHLNPVEFHLTIPDSAAQSINRILRQHAISAKQPFVVLHPGSGGSAMDWPPSYFAELAAQIHAQMGIPVIITGSAAEKNLVDMVVQKAGCPIIRLDGQLSIKELASLLQCASLHITNSTGPLHIASALGTEVIGIYCPITACSPTRWGPYQRMDSVLVPEVPYCERCAKDGCRYMNCMELVSVQEVFALAVKKLRRQL